MKRRKSTTARRGENPRSAASKVVAKAKSDSLAAPAQAASPLTHIDQRGQARMVDVTEKGVTERDSGGGRPRHHAQGNTGPRA